MCFGFTVKFKLVVEMMPNIQYQICFKYKRVQLSTCGDDVNKGVIKGWRREYRPANVGRRHENINTKCALYTLYAWIIDSFVHARIYQRKYAHNMHLHLHEDNCKWHQR